MMKAIIKFGEKHRPLSAGERIGCWTFLLAILLAFVDIRLSLMVLAGFVVMCIAAPFFPGSNFYLPVVSRGSSGRKAVALTFDDGPDPQTTPELLRLLKKHRVAGTFFVNGRKAGLYPHLIEEILSHGHSVANHSFNHDVFMAFRGKRTVIRDIEAVQEVLRRHGIAPLAFRPPVGITSPRLREVLQTKGMFAVNFSCRARDGGNRWLRHLSLKILQAHRTRRHRASARYRSTVRRSAVFVGRRDRPCPGRNPNEGSVRSPASGAYRKTGDDKDCGRRCARWWFSIFR